MKIYLVGGAVRDELLGIKTQDNDYVVVGASIEEMLSQGFEKVGADFPVFLHPESKEEYALARKEKKTGVGYKGFEFEWENISLEEDLKRRDLTINAMAKDLESHKIIDPYNGKEDIQNKVLRHVSAHFVEDPLRVYRVARFFATFKNFVVASQTKLLCEKIVKSGEIASLTAERVFIETKKALKTDNPERFFEYLHDIEALGVFEFVDELNMLQLKEIVPTVKDEKLRFASLFYSTKSKDIKQVEKLCEHLKVPNSWKKISLFVAKFSSFFTQSQILSSEEIYQILNEARALNSVELMTEFLMIADPNDQIKNYFFKLIHFLKEIDLSEKLSQVENEYKADEVKRLMIEAIETYNLKYGLP